jgi:N-acylneuraminate cytidylyltransferase
MGDVVNVFLPMRAGSERISNKNTKSFSGIDGGLCLIKLKQLLQCKLINSIIVSTDDIKVMDICS